MNSLPFDNSMIRLCAIELISNGGGRGMSWMETTSFNFGRRENCSFHLELENGDKNLFARLMDFLFELTIDFADICW